MKLLIEVPQSIIDLAKKILSEKASDDMERYLINEASEKSRYIEREVIFAGGKEEYPQQFKDAYCDFALFTATCVIKSLMREKKKELEKQSN